MGFDSSSNFVYNLYYYLRIKCRKEYSNYEKEDSSLYWLWLWVLYCGFFLKSKR
jgi:hypothetical protein